MAADATTTFDREALLDEVVTAYLKEARAGRTPEPAAWQARYPELTTDLAEFFADRAALERVAEPLRTVAQEAPTTVGDDYEIVAEIARGGMGIVYKARQKSLNRVVALKMVQPGRAAEDGERFRREAEAAAHLDHPHIVPIYEVGEDGGRPFFSMKFIDGVDLSQLFRGDAEKRRDRATVRRAVGQLATVARAVHYAHQRGILHRDLKPSNILIDQAGQPHVANFGLAKRVEGDSTTTQSGSITGTPSYMAPEQAAGAPTLTTAVDVYALGAILYEMLTGQPPFRADTPLDTILQVRTQEPRRPRSLNPKADRDLETMCLKCLAKDPARRYGSAEALAEDLERWLGGEAIVARKASTWERIAKWAKRRPALAALVSIAAGLLVAIFGLLTWGWQQADGKASAEADARKAAEKQAQAEQDARKAAERQTEAEKKRADEASRRVGAVKAHLSLNIGCSYLDRGDTSAGLLWLVRGLEEAPDDEAELTQSLRRLLGGWRGELTLPRAVLPEDRFVNGIAFAPDGKTFATTGRVLSSWAPRLAEHLYEFQGSFVRRWDAKTLQPLADKRSRENTGDDHDP